MNSGEAASVLELETKVHEDFTITEKAPTRTFSLLKVPTGAFTFKSLYAKRTPLVIVNFAKVRFQL